jgi:serine O-acetyltransferase
MINAVVLYRIAHQLWRWNVPLLPKIIKLIIFLLYNSSIPYQCEIGAGSFFAYGGIGVIIHRNSRIGNNVNIGSNVVIGGRMKGEGVATIGNNVYLATGSKILGEIEIGDYVVVGANSVVTKSVPSHSVVAGIPAKIIRSGISIEEFTNLI